MNSAEVRVGRSRRARRPLAEQQRGGNGFPAAMPAVAGSGTTVSVRVSECHFLLHRSTPHHAHRFVAWSMNTERTEATELTAGSQPPRKFMERVGRPQR